MDYSAEPPHSDLLDVQALQPFNAEPPSDALVEFNLTPEELVYCRNHGPVRVFPEDDYCITIKGMVEQEMSLSLRDIKASYPKISVVAALQCAGNRRNEMGQIKPVHGVGWNDGVIANCRWGGVRLCDVLKRVGVQYQSDIHVCFASYATLCQDDTYYGSSIPIKKAMEMGDDVLLAYEMNDEPLTPEHGGPLRLVVPGVLGARWVKWLDTIIVSAEESPNFYQQRDYKVLPPNIETKDAAKDVWSKYPSMTALPLNSVVASAIYTSDSSLFVKGYAVPGGSGNVASVHVTVDDGATWTPANLVYQQGKWSWTIWEVELSRVSSSGVVFSRAKDQQGNVQIREGVWNMRGVAYNAWGHKSW